MLVVQDLPGMVSGSDEPACGKWFRISAEVAFNYNSNSDVMESPIRVGRVLTLSHDPLFRIYSGNLN